MIAYLAAETRFAGERPEFTGKPGKLLVYWLLAWLPLIIFIVVAVFALGFRPAHGGDVIAMVLFTVAVILMTIPFVYLVYRWYMNFLCAGVSVRWKTEFWPACLYIFGQLCLTIITVGIYWPAAFLRLYEYFAGQTVFEREGVEIGRLGFEGALGKGFGLLWGQTLLCIVTLGVYIPWGYSKMGRWIVANSYYKSVGDVD
jgi:hypothetical protein